MADNNLDKKEKGKVDFDVIKAKVKNKYEEIKEELKNPVKRAVRAKKAGEVSFSILRGFLIFGLSFIIIFPIFEQFTFALRDPLDINDPLVKYIPKTFTTVNFTIASAIMDFWKALLNNIKVSTISTICQVLSTALAGYAFARLKFKGSNVLFWIIMLTLIVPPQTVALSRSLYFANFDVLGIIKLFNHGSGLALKGEGHDIVFYIMSLTGQGIRSALFIFIFRQFFRGIPIELEESAQIDGAGVVRTFWSVMLPNARGAITTVALFAFVWQWNDVYYTKMYEISGDSFPMLTMKLINIAEWISGLLKSPQFKHLANLVSDEVKDNAQFASIISNTAALLMMLPLLIGYLFVQRLFIEGVERSGIIG
ncbi:MAG: carbohydrate ABC transporter permease [Bacilli bacterium]|nr:carbohydrate ABC transporter permease [Mollicutes bacterium]MDY3899081.1 carbohydrate ABC transporter permease [Bacilli bacterium]